ADLEHERDRKHDGRRPREMSGPRPSPAPRRALGLLQDRAVDMGRRDLVESRLPIRREAIVRRAGAPVFAVHARLSCGSSASPSARRSLWTAYLSRLLTVSRVAPT